MLVSTFRRREKSLALPRLELRIFQPVVIYDVYGIQVHFKINLAEIRWAGVEEIHVAQDPIQRQGLENRITNLRTP